MCSRWMASMSAFGMGLALVVGECRQAAAEPPQGVLLTQNPVVDMGGTYYTLEAKARKVTMRFPDRVATAERLIDGDLRTTLQDLSGQELARLRVHRKALLAADLDFNGIRAETTLPLQPTLDWAGLQTFAL